MDTGICALIAIDSRTDRIINDIGRKSLNSSEFMLKIVKFVLFIALRLSMLANSLKKVKIEANTHVKVTPIVR